MIGNHNGRIGGLLSRPDPTPSGSYRAASVTPTAGRRRRLGGAVGGVGACGL
ncbi:hypothetical protein AB0G04_08160 [Actinoplanes sp. NPDC023801]|uniref:hypothetical protein n=1 Tax=Actinoplanes sp. NPDC023801 TaxID=3154595 RepID=UPI00340259F0